MNQPGVSEPWLPWWKMRGMAIANQMRIWADPWAPGHHSTPSADDLRFLSVGQRTFDVALSDTVVAAREGGMPWSEIAAALGITRQSAWAKYRDAKPSKLRD